MQLRSRVGRGTRFRLVLPRCDAQAAPGPWAVRAEAVPAPAVPVPGRILLIDDDAEIRAAMTELLRAHGIDLEAVAGEAEAAALLASGPAPFRALLCDYRLANGDNGLDVGQRLRARFALAAPLMLVTGETAPERLQRVRASGVPVLFKPVEAMALLRALAELAPHGTR